MERMFGFRLEQIKEICEQTRTLITKYVNFISINQFFKHYGNYTPILGQLYRKNVILQILNKATPWIKISEIWNMIQITINISYCHLWALCWISYFPLVTEEISFQISILKKINKCCSLKKRKKKYMFLLISHCSRNKIHTTL